MKKQTNYKITLSGGIYKGIEINPDGSVTLLMEMLENIQPTVKTNADITFVCIPISTLTMQDNFIWYSPNTPNEVKFKKKIEEILSEKKILEDLWIPVDHTKIKLFGHPIHSLGYGSASCNTWIKNGELNNWKLLKVSQYILLLSWMLKILIEKEGWDHNKAWNAICDNSELLCYLNWEKIFGFKNFLTSAKKYLLPDDISKDKGCFIASGGLNDIHWNYPLAQITKDSRRDCGLKDAPYKCYGFICK